MYMMGGNVTVPWPKLVRSGCVMGAWRVRFGYATEWRVSGALRVPTWARAIAACCCQNPMSRVRYSSIAVTSSWPASVL